MNKVKARLVCYGIDDELKNDSSSIFSTTINSTLYPVPTPIVPSQAPIVSGTRTGVEAVNFTQRLNTKRYRFSLNPNLKNISLSKNSKLIIESITIPNVINDLYLQSKCVNNVVLKLKGISNHNIWDSSTKGKGASIIFSCPLLLNTQGFGRTYDATSSANPDFNLASQKARINCDNNGYLFMNSNPNSFYNFSISEDFLRNGILEFELIYDIGNITSLTNLIGAPLSALTVTNTGSGYSAPVTVTFTSTSGTGATATADLGFPINQAFVPTFGTGYTSDPTVTFSAPTGLGGTTATGTATRGFPLQSITTTNGGSGYSSAPTVVISPPPPTVVANVTALVSGGFLTGITINSAGLGYIVAPVVSFTGGGGTGATATAIISATTTRITGFTITNPGSGYTSAPTVTLSGGGGIQATGTCSLNGGTGQITPVVLGIAGSGYLTAPTVTFVGGGSPTAQPTTTVLLSTTGGVKSITITSPGSGYLTPPTISFSGGAGTGAVGGCDLTSTNGMIKALTLTSGGSGYATAPTVTLTGGAGVGATATATVGTATEAHYTQIPQTLDITTDKNDLESFMISMVITDEEEDDKIYNDKKMLNKINSLLLDKIK